MKQYGIIALVAVIAIALLGYGLYRKQKGTNSNISTSSSSTNMQPPSTYHSSFSTPKKAGCGCQKDRI